MTLVDRSGADPRVEIQAGLRRATNYNQWIVDQALPHLGRRVLDAGCGAGNLARLLIPHSDLVVGVDEWPEFGTVVGADLAGQQGFVFVEADLRDPALPDRLREYRLDSAICANVLEHIDDDVGALRAVAASLTPGSPLFILVPAFMALYGAHDRADHHVRRYTRRSLGAALTLASLHVEQTYYMNLPGFFAWLGLVRVLGRTLSEDVVGVYDRVVPAIRAVEQRMRPPFGQSVVAIARTPA